MNKRWKLFGLLLLAMSMLLAACGGNNSGKTEEQKASSPNPGTEGQASNAASEPVKFTLMRGGSGLPAADKDVLLQQLNKNLNMEMEYLQVPAEYEQQLNVKLAGGTPPDVFDVKKNQMVSLVGQNMLLDLTPYLDRMSNLTPENGFTEDHMKKGQVNGKQYAIPYRPLIPVQTTFWIRQDWLDKLNLQAPKTLDELKAVAKAFVEQDPDGNGKKDTIGITGNGLEGTLGPIFAAFGVASPGHIMIKDNQVAYSTELPEMIQAVEYIKGMYEEGLIDPEFLTNNGLMHQEKAFKGQAGIVYAHWAHMKRPDMVEKMNAINPSQVWTQLDAMTGPGGKFADYYDAGNSNARWVIPATLAKEPEKVDKIIEYLNYISGGEGQDLVNYGIEGVHFNRVDGKPVINPDKVSEVGHATIHQLTGRIEMDYLNARFGDIKEYFEFTNQLPVIEVYDGFASIPDGVNASDKQKYETEEIIKFMYGKRPISEYGAFIETMKKTFQLDRYIEVADKDLRALDYIR